MKQIAFKKLYKKEKQAGAGTHLVGTAGKTLTCMKAIWNGHVVAESDDTIVVGSDYYFPPDALRMEYFQESGTHTTSPWIGEASYYTLSADNEESKDAAWYYPSPSEQAKHIRDYVAFRRGVEVIKD